LILKGNLARLGVQSWAPHLRMAKEFRFVSDPDVWYRMKLRVDVGEERAVVRGEVWRREGPGPDAWTIEATDPHPNCRGSPGLYVYALAERYFDNIVANEE